MSDHRAMNLAVVRADLRDAEEPRAGYERVAQLIASQRDMELQHLLRHHSEEAVYGNEVEQRDQIDDLVRYYSVLMAGLFAGAIAPVLPGDTIEELRMLAANKRVRKYVWRNYPLRLPQLLLAYAAQPPVAAALLDLFLTADDNGFYDRFIALNQSVDRDEEVKMFLLFLDDVSIGGEGLNELLKLIPQQQQLSRVLTDHLKRPNTLGSAFWGMVKYMQFMAGYLVMLEAMGGRPLLQSVFWHHHAYWFNSIADDVGGKLNSVLVNLSDALEQGSLSEDFADADEPLAKRAAASELEYLRTAVERLLDPTWGAPLVELCRSLGLAEETK